MAIGLIGYQWNCPPSANPPSLHIYHIDGDNYATKTFYSDIVSICRSAVSMVQVIMAAATASGLTAPSQ